MWHRNLVLKNCWLPIMREMMLHANAVKQVRHGGIVKRRKNWEKVCNARFPLWRAPAGSHGRCIHQTMHEI